MALTSNQGSKNISSWTTCLNCQSIYHQKDNEIHATECDLETTWLWKHNFIKNEIIYTNIESCYIMTDFTNIANETEALNHVFISELAMQICKIAIGDPIILCFKQFSIIKLAWPISNDNITNISLVKSAIQLDRLEGSVKIQKLTDPIYHIDEIYLKYYGQYKLPPSSELNNLLKKCNTDKIITTSNKITCSCFKELYVFHIECINSKEAQHENNESSMISNEVRNKLFYKIDYRTNFKIYDNNYFRPLFRYKLIDIGGYDDLKKDIQNVINTSISPFSNETDKPCNGILLCGPSGVGKTMMAEAIMNECKQNVIIINLSKILNKLINEVELELTNKFKEAKISFPSIIYIQNLDILFQKTNNSENDYKKKIIYILMNLFDEIVNLQVIALATITNINIVDSLLKQHGKFDKVFEITSPNQNTRIQIFKKMLEQVKHDLSEKDLTEIALETRGCVGSDLKMLYDKAATNSLNDNVNNGNVILKKEHLLDALKIITPSAMKGVSVEVSPVKWEDIGGEKLKEELKRTVELSLYHPELLEKMGLPPPRGILMYGPPGCSKTMIAKAWATESKMNFLSIQAADLFSKWVGDSEKAVRQVFEKARQVSPSIIFIDEFDAIGGRRGASSNEGGTNVETRVLSQILNELDGVSSLGKVFIIAATNRPDRIDSALLRPGRFDNIIYVPLPNAETREEIFNIKLKKMPLDKNIDKKDLVKRTEGYSGADIQAVCVKAYMNAISNDMKVNSVTMNNFNEALSIVKPSTPNNLIEIYNKFNKL